MQKATTHTFMPALDGVRAFAALAVLALHAAGRWLPGGYIGVDVFFVLSGFLITGLIVGELDRTGRLDVRRFYVRRSLRLLPALVLLCVVQTVVLALLPGTPLHGASLFGLLTGATYTSSFFAAAGHDLGEFTHTWSLSDEEVFYVVWPMAILLFRRSRHLVALVLGATVASILWQIGVALTGAGVDRLYYPPDMRAEQLLIGCSLAVLLRRKGARVPQWLGAVGAVFLAAYGLAAGHVALLTYLRGGTVLVALAAACLIGALACTGDSWLAKPFTGRLQLWLGKRSYGLYIWHPLAVLLVISYGPGQPLLRLPLAILLGVAFAAVSYHFVEAPFLRMKDRYGTRRAVPAAPLQLVAEA